jgi:3-methylcrotonyl-CoA carboxylase alpha subunit
MRLAVDGEPAEVTVLWADGFSVRDRDGQSSFRDFLRADPRRLVSTPDGVLVLAGGRQTQVAARDPFAVDLEHMDEGGTVKAPMHGKLVAVFVRPGDKVEKGQRLAVVEAMKMEHALVAPTAGEVAEVAAEPGAQVAEGARLIVIKTENDTEG